ncbi:MAG: hypothetical protein Q7J68_08120, partial [Thermoplasmata archaeon]|nr:hypothetical protein [Thermoplasmata archaeon]
MRIPDFSSSTQGLRIYNQEERVDLLSRKQFYDPRKMCAQKISKPEFRSLEEANLIEVHRRQIECLPDIAEMFDNKPSWTQLTLAQMKEKIVEKQKKPHTALFSIYSGEEFIGIGEWSTSWDTWSPHAWFIIWPEQRRKGLG